MNINNDNYEEYFLLYVDNELTSAQRQIVEMFVKANPHLQKEWNELLATVQNPENISLGDKSFLLKRPMDSFIDNFNHEKRFVEYHDGELSDAEKMYVLDFLKEHPSCQNEFNLIGKAYLSADDSIVFSDKPTLYRKSAVVRYGLFIRIAAAAMFIGFIFWLGLQLNRNQTPQRTIVRNIPTMPVQKTITPAPKPAMDAKTLADNKPQKSPTEKKVAAYAKSGTPASKVLNEKSKSENTQKEENLMVEEHTEIAAMIPVSGNNAILDANKTAIISDIPTTVEPLSTTAIHDADISPEKEYASFRQEPQENNYVFTDIPAENIQRSKLGIFIKKVKRTIDRNNPINRLLNAEED